jgi:glucose dehydrogenase
MNNEFDVVVVGAGVAGALVAWKLAEAKFTVGLIDAGEKRLETIDRAGFVRKFAEVPTSNKPPLPSKSPSQPYVDEQNAKFAHSPDVVDFNLFKPGSDLYFVQTGDVPFKSQYQRIVGGSTWSWRGNCPRYIPSDFKLRTLYGVGADYS